jgi:phosphatidate cytidylyltransferase
MLWSRVLTALVLAPLAIGAILLLETAYFAAVLGVLVLVGAAELARLSGLAGTAASMAFVGLVALALWLAWTLLDSGSLHWALWLLAGWWCATTAVLLARRAQLARVTGVRIGNLVLGGLLLAGAWASVVALHRTADGQVLVLYLFVLIWLADSGAYFAGRALGRHKLSPAVSPGKTWEGAAGGLAGALLAALVLVLGGFAGPLPLAAFVVLSLLVALVSIGGDLWESRLKREAGVKDSGSLLPGHGGILDRVDSLIAAAPVYALGLSLIRGSL